jgi:hypothetical protein
MQCARDVRGPGKQIDRYVQQTGRFRAVEAGHIGPLYRVRLFHTLTDIAAIASPLHPDRRR